MPDHNPALPARVTSSVPPAPSDGNGTPPAPVSPLDTGPEGIDWRRYLAAAKRYRWPILALVLLGAAGGVMATRMRPARYLAQATIWMQTNSEQQRGAVRGPIGNDQLMPSAGAIHLAKSYMVLDGVVRERRMYLGVPPRDRAALESLTVREEYRPGFYRVVVDPGGQTYRLLEGTEGLQLETGAVGDSIGRELGIRWAPTAATLRPGADVSFSLSSARDAAQGLASALTVGIDPSGSFLRISMSGPDGAAAAAIVNAVADRFIAVSTDLKRSKLSELARLLDDQLAAAKENLRRAEDALAAFRVRTITLPSEGSSASGAVIPANTSEFVKLTLEQEELRRDRESIARILAQSAQPGGSIDALSYVGAVQKSADLTNALAELTKQRAELRSLLLRYTDEHPSVQQLRADIAELERMTIPALARTVLAQLESRDQALQPQIAAGSRELQAVPQRAVQEARLRRDAEIAAGLYTAVQSRQSEARLAEASSVADVRLLDRAVAPRAPVRVMDPRFLILGVLIGLGAGLVGAVVADRLDPRVRYAQQVTGEMGLHILGMLPHVKNRDAGPNDEQVAQLIEAVRSVRLNLMHAYGSGTPLLVTVTSPGVGDGKSFVSSRLAIACAQAGQRTLLIDGDARRGALHRNLKVSRTPGLTDFLGERAPFEAVLQATSYRLLHFIGAGKRLRESPELLGSPAMLELFARVRPSYDVIVVDSPPLGAGVDPCILGTLTGSMLLVLRSGATHRDVTRTHLAMVSQLPIRLLGVVLNDVGPAGMYGYYGYYYLAGYGTEETAEEKVDAGRPQVVVGSRSGAS